MKILIILFILCLVATVVSAQEFVLRSNASGLYENGEFTPGNDKYEAEVFVDVEEGTIRVKKVNIFDREGRVEENISYEIINNVYGEGFSSISLAENKKGQNIYVAIRDNKLGETETLVLGERFYEYSKGYNGKFYLESGLATNLHNE